MKSEPFTRTDFPLPRLALELPHNAIFAVPDVAGVSIECHSGSVWLTLDDDPRDIVLSAGDRFAGNAHRRALVSALEPSRIGVDVPRPELAYVATAARTPAPSHWRFGRHGLSPA